MHQELNLQAQRRQQEREAERMAAAMQEQLAAPEQQMLEEQQMGETMQALFAEPEEQLDVRQVHNNQGRKKAQTKTPEKIEREREKRRQAALQRDRHSVRRDKARHGFYTAVKGVVTGFQKLNRQNRAQRGVQENTTYMQSLKDAYQEMYAMRLQAQENGTEEMFLALHASYYLRVKAQYEAACNRADLEARNEDGVLDEQLYESRLLELLQQEQVPMQFGRQQRANVVGGTKPAAVQYAENGSKWLVKESVSCVGAKEPYAAMMTEAGYRIQKLVNPDTAIEAFRGQSVGRGIVSYQRMIAGVKRDDVDLFRFSRTPEAMTQAELRRIQELSPQLLREHTTDWLLCNFDTKGENFVIANDGTGPDRLYGVDKEASFRAILDEGAQHMSKDYQRFDQNTVYNRLFQMFADGTMDLDLQSVTTQIERVEAMSDEEYIGIFRDFLRAKEREYARKPEKYEQVRRNLLARKTNLRMEYRDFFTKLVEERCAHVSPIEQLALRRQYFGDDDGGTFIFRGETAEQLQAERERRKQARNADHEEMERRAQQADINDEKSYKRRHALYDFSKAVVMGVKKAASKHKAQREEQRATVVPLSEIRLEDENIDPALQTYVRQRIEQLRERFPDEAELAQQMQQETVELRLVDDHEIFLGGTKPMSEYVAADGSKWLAKQAVNCMGYYKIEGALLTESGARLQKIVHPETAVDAFVGRTNKHGDVSFQRRLEHVESGPNKLDLFKFSKHPELATEQTVQQVQALAPQILREHTTDWLLCNFDTKGENFIITLDENGQRVLHGIDKEAAFNKILSPEAQHMSRDYRPHANDTLYNVIFRMYANNEMELNLFDVLPQIERMEALDDETYMQTFDSYLQHVDRKKKPEEAAQIRANILARKQGLRREYENFFTQLILARCKKLHPEEAAALKDRYFGHGRRFRFPTAG